MIGNNLKFTNKYICAKPLVGIHYTVDKNADKRIVNKKNVAFLHTYTKLPIILIKYKLMIRQSFNRILRVQGSKSEVTKFIDI